MSKKGEKCKSCGAHCAFEITLLQAIMLTLLLVCAFSPRVHSIPRGPLTLKSQNFDEIVFFSAGSEKSSVLGVHDFSGSAEKAKYRKIMTFYRISPPPRQIGDSTSYITAYCPAATARCGRSKYKCTSSPSITAVAFSRG